jgi:hypothetical protein
VFATAVFIAMTLIIIIVAKDLAMAHHEPDKWSRMVGFFRNEFVFLSYAIKSIVSCLVD